MKYFLDTEFHEFKKKPLLGKAIDTIELISIGIVSEDDREYYALCNEFDLKAAWDNEWLRENVLKPIYKELHDKENLNARQALYRANVYIHETDFKFNYKNLKKLINNYGKTNKEIAKEIRNFVMAEKYDSGGQVLLGDFYPNDKPNPEFYAYYADYDWVVFCWLFGRMNDLPKGFPMYCRDLKQELDDYINTTWLPESIEFMKGTGVDVTFDLSLERLKELDSFPKQNNEHNALDDAKWNLKLKKFIDSL